MSDLQTMNVSDLGLVDGIRLACRAEQGGRKVVDWALDNSEDVERLLRANGALLIRGLRIVSSRQLAQVLSTLFGDELISYRYRSTPRTELRGNVYTATEYHPGEAIPLHNENSYTNEWAMRIGFCCMLPATEGGETPIADSRTVYEAIDPDIRSEFETRKILYVRNYGDIDLPWQEVFQTEDKSEVERYCKENSIDYEWFDDGTLRTKQINQAVATHPNSGEKLWFNQAHLFHVTSMRPEVRDSLLSVMEEDRLPRNTYFGDGGDIEQSALDHIREIYRRSEIVFPWQKHDLLLLDNMLFSHGRRPFKGERNVLVAMGRPHCASI